MIDILLATFNGERFVREQIDSLQAQTFTNWRLLISDDCSEDDTLAIVRETAAKDSRIVIASEGVRYGSAKENFMSLLHRSSAPYVMFCDQDDVWLPEKIALSFEKMRLLEREFGAESPLLVFSDMQVVDADLNIIQGSFESYSRLDPCRTSFPHVLAQSLGAGCTFLFNRALVCKSKCVTNCEEIVMHDWWVSVVAAAFGYIGYVETPCVLYRQHNCNSVGATSFDPAFWLGKSEVMVQRQERISRQARVFLDTYYEELDEAYLRAALECSRVCSDGSVANLAHLLKSGAWKSGSRQISQIVAAVRGVVAAVVTHNPDIGRLIENIDAISQQVDAVIVFDNATVNAQPVAELLDDKGCVSCFSEVNTGMAFALNRLCELGYVLGAKYALLLDQDSVASGNMVETLSKQFSENVAIVSPEIVDRNKQEGKSDRDGAKMVKRAIASGAMIDLALWKAIDGFDEALFVDWVDYEYSANVRRNGYLIKRCFDTYLLHEMGCRELAFEVRFPFSAMSKRFYRTNHSMNRQCDKARSWELVRRKYGLSKVGLEERMYIKAIQLRDFALERNRVELAKAFREGKQLAKTASSTKNVQRRSFNVKP